MEFHRCCSSRRRRRRRRPTPAAVAMAAAAVAMVVSFPLPVLVVVVGEHDGWCPADTKESSHSTLTETTPTNPASSTRGCDQQVVEVLSPSEHRPLLTQNKQTTRDDQQDTDDDDDTTTSTFTATCVYELLEPLHLELGVGGKVRHAVDYAYSPVVGAGAGRTSHVIPSRQSLGRETADSSATDDTSVTAATAAVGEDVTTLDTCQTRVVSQTQANNAMVRHCTTSSQHAAASQQPITPSAAPTKASSSLSTILFSELWKWWQWWMPWNSWQQERHQQHVYCLSTKYKLQSEAFAGGSHGEVWKGYKRGPTSRQRETAEEPVMRQGEDQPTVPPRATPSSQPLPHPALIFKRLRVNRGFRTLEAGLREVYFGKRLLSLRPEHNSRDDDDDDIDQTRVRGPNASEKQGSTTSTNHRTRGNDSQTKAPLNNSRPASSFSLFTEYVEHFFDDSDGELWIVFQDAGPSLRTFLYSGTDTGDYVVYHHSWLWTLMRMSLHAQRDVNDTDENHHQQPPPPSSDSTVEELHPLSPIGDSDPTHTDQQYRRHPVVDPKFGRAFINTLMRQILTAAKTLHENGIVHRDIKPSNIMCQTNIDLERLQSSSSWDIGVPTLNVSCVLGDYSSAWDDFTHHNLYTRGPSRLEQTDEYAPPEAIFGYIYDDTHKLKVAPSFDSWSIGIVVLELLLGTPNVFSVDQRTRAVLSQKMQKRGATPQEIERAIYLAALSQFCIYNPSQSDWPLRSGDPLHQSAMTKQSCTLHDFHRALRARDPLGWGFEASDNTLLHLIWQLLAWDPSERMTASEALNHPYFSDSRPHRSTDTAANDLAPGEHNALESQMLDPRMDFNVSDSIGEFKCPKCGRVFADWKSCHSHANVRQHAKFCTYDASTLPTCLNAHAMLPAHASSGYCDIQGRRRTIEDFHAIHLLPFQQFYGIFDGHLGNFASKYAASFLYGELTTRLSQLPAGRMVGDDSDEDGDPHSWKRQVERSVQDSFASVHEKFLLASRTMGSHHRFMGQSGTTATTLLVTNASYIVASIGDSRAVLSTRRRATDVSRHGSHNLFYLDEFVALPLTTDHIASNPMESASVQQRGGRILRQHNGKDRVNGTLIITRSIGDADLAPWLSRTPDVVLFSRNEILDTCHGGSVDYTRSSPGDSTSSTSTSTGTGTGTGSRSSSIVPCFMILASDGLWDTVSNQEAVDLVAHVVSQAMRAEASQTLKGNASAATPMTSSSSSSTASVGCMETASWQQAAEALTLEAYVRGSTDNIGVCVVAIE